MADILGRKSYSRISDVLTLPSLIEVQLESFNWFLNEGLAELFEEVSPIESFNGGMQLWFPSKRVDPAFNLKYRFDKPKYTLDECVDRDMTFAAPLYVEVLLLGSEVPNPIKNEIFLGDFPLMTDNGTFIVNGTERVVVSQLIRSPGVYFEAEEDRNSGRNLAAAKLIPDRGAWMEFETRKSDYITIKFNRKRTVPVTILLRALAAVSDGLPESAVQTGSDEEILKLFEGVDNNPDHLFIPATLRQEPTWERKEKRSISEEALIEFYKRMRPGDPPTLDNAREYLEQQLFDQRRYDLERVGRYKLNQKLELTEIIPLSHRTVTKHDIIALVKRMININNSVNAKDDIDHLGNRRVKTVGELIQNKLRIGIRRAERVIRERMSIRDQDNVTPLTLINIRPVVAAIREFFGSSQLSQFMEQTNPLAELTHKRTLSALGPGGLRRERAGFDVRDVHYSHYGRICPIETPEGPNIGLIGRLATYGKVNQFGFIETPYRKVYRALKPDDKRLLGRKLREDILDPKGGQALATEGEEITKDLLKRVAKLDLLDIPVVPFVSEEIYYLSADAEDRYTIAQATTPLNDQREFLRARPSCRHASKFLFATPDMIDYMDVAPRQIVGISAALIPFLEHDDANRALMGSNMQRQAVPLLRPDVPIVSTGMEMQAARDSGQVIVCDEDGEVVSVTGKEIVVQTGTKRRTYRLRKYNRSNQSTCIDQRPAVVKGQRVKKGEVIADSSSTDHGELALGQNVLVAFMSWEGGNYEDAILISERLVREDKFTSIHIEEYEVEARDTKLGPEEITYDIPNVGEDALKDLDEFGIIRVGAEVGPNDILVGKITPKGEKELTPEEKLLRAIFGEKAREVKDSSLRLPHGEKGKVIGVQIHTRDEYHDLAAGVDKMVRVSVAQRRKLTEGDKMAGRHGNKGVISRVVPVADMPFLEDGTPIDIILNPLGVPGRMNIGQILETHLGWAADRLGFRAVTPVFDGAHEEEIEAEMARAWLVTRAWREVTNDAWNWLKEQGYDPESIEDDSEARRLYLDTWLRGKKYSRELMATNELYARRAAAAEWLRGLELNPDELLVFEDSTVPVLGRQAVDKQVIDVCLRMWMEDHGHKGNRWEGEDLRRRADALAVESGDPLPTLGKQALFDGKSGDRFDQPVTIGVIHMLKLAHLVEDKVHARRPPRPQARGRDLVPDGAPPHVGEPPGGAEGVPRGPRRHPGSLRRGAAAVVAGPGDPAHGAHASVAQDLRGPRGLGKLRP